jgi:hypothetical protein
MAILQGSDDSPSGGGLSDLAHIVIEKVKTQSAINPVPVGNLILLATVIELGDAPILCESFVA